MRRASGVLGAMEQDRGEVRGHGPGAPPGPEPGHRAALPSYRRGPARRVLGKALGHRAGSPAALREGARPGLC